MLTCSLPEKDKHTATMLLNVVKTNVLLHNEQKLTDDYNESKRRTSSALNTQELTPMTKKFKTVIENKHIILENDYREMIKHCKDKTEEIDLMLMAVASVVRQKKEKDD